MISNFTLFKLTSGTRYLPIYSQSRKQKSVFLRPDFLELVHSHEAWGTKMRVDLIWRPPAASSLAVRPTNQRPALSRSRATPPPLPPRPDDGEEELVTIIKSKELASKLKQKARKLMEVEESCWASKEMVPTFVLSPF